MRLKLFNFCWLKIKDLVLYGVFCPSITGRFLLSFLLILLDGGHECHESLSECVQIAHKTEVECDVWVFHGAEAPTPSTLSLSTFILSNFSVFLNSTTLRINEIGIILVVAQSVAFQHRKLQKSKITCTKPTQKHTHTLTLTGILWLLFTIATVFRCFCQQPTANGPRLYLLRLERYLHVLSYIAPYRKLEWTLDGESSRFETKNIMLSASVNSFVMSQCAMLYLLLLLQLLAPSIAESIESNMHVLRSHGVPVGAQSECIK